MSASSKTRASLEECGLGGILAVCGTRGPSGSGSSSCFRSSSFYLNARNTRGNVPSDLEESVESLATSFSRQLPESPVRGIAKQEQSKAPEVLKKGQQAEQQTGDMETEIQQRIDGNPVLVMATSTCPFCVEAKRTFEAHGFTGCFVDMDKETNTREMRKAVASLAGNRTSVPQIWINKKYIGGCDDLKALDVTGDLGLKLNSFPNHNQTGDAEDAVKERATSESRDSAVTIFPGPQAAFFSTFHSPATVDHRVVRVNGVITFLIAVSKAVFADHRVTEWVVLGLLVDFVLKLAGFPSPLGLLAALPFAGTKPHYSVGASKQFANLCGVFFASVSWACLAGDKTLGAYIMLAMLAGAAFLQGFLDFCAGCFIFEYLLKWGLVSKSVYRMHIYTRANLVYSWEKDNIRTGKEVSPEAVTHPTQGLPLNPTDLCAKPGKESDKWQRFHLIKYCHVSYFMVPLSVLGLALPWAMLSETIGTVRAVWQTLAWAGVVLHAVVGALFIAKCVLYPSKVKKEWQHPIHRNSFGLPFLNLVLLSWMAAKWPGASGSGELAEVLFWMGTVPLASLTFFTIASWITIPVDEEYMNPSWMIIPVGNLAGAVAARQVNSEYVEWGWFQFSIGTLLWLALWPITLWKAVPNTHSDFRLRSLYGVWVAPPAVAMLAFSSLEDAVTFDPVQRLLFYASLSIALALAFCVWPFNFFLEGAFDMSAWAFAFPLDVLAGAAVTAHGYTHSKPMRVIYAVSMTAACVVNVINLLFTLGALKGKKIFNPAGKWSPLSFMVLTHEAFREAVQTLTKLSVAVKPGVQGASTLRQLSATWSSMSKAHGIHSMHEDKVIFPVLEGFFPGQTYASSGEHEEHEKLMATIQTTIDTLLNGVDKRGDEPGRATLLDELKVYLSVFGKQLVEHLDHEEQFFATPVARKYLPLQTTKDLARESWNATNNSDMFEFVGWVMVNLRARGQRTRFLKTWVWAMPERAQQLGLMVYRAVDDVTWVEVARDLPNVIPRGLPGHCRYF